MSLQVAAVTMTSYKPAAGVEAGFKTYLQQLYAAAEDSSSNAPFLSFFVPDSASPQLVVLANTATGSKQIVALKEELLPPSGDKHWDHHPNETTIYTETASSKTYEVLGIIQTTYDEGNCSAAYYTSRFTVLKKSGQVELTAGNLQTYDDLIVDPQTSPTEIKCFL